MTPLDVELLRSTREDYHAFVVEYREAADRLKLTQSIGGWFDPAIEFPTESFLPALAFVGATLAAPPPRPPSRRLEYDESDPLRKIIGRGEIPVISVPRRQPSELTDELTPPASVPTPGRAPPKSRDGAGLPD